MERDNIEQDDFRMNASPEQSVRSANARLAARLRSPWWFHALYGFFVGCIAFGVGERPAWVVVALFVGLAGMIAVTRWRARRIGFSRANPSRFTFLREGAPWSAISYGLFVIAVAVNVFARQFTLLEAGLVAAAAGLAMAALGPLADRAGRRRLARAAL